MKKILLTGAVGQIGSELTMALRKRYGNDNVIALGHKTKPSDLLRDSGPFEVCDVSDEQERLRKIIEKYNIDTIYHLASILSAAGEKNPDRAWHTNLIGLKNVLELAKEYNLARLFWPSSIAAFGPHTPREKTPQVTIMDPNTMYGLTKVTGELLCNYYFEKYGLDVRSLRYPGLISYETLPGGGTTDYAVAIFYAALQPEKAYICFLKEDTVLPMMYMPDAIRAAIEIMEVDPSKIKTHLSYNVTAISFSPQELAEEIKKHIPGFKCIYQPDERQKIADSWPKVIDDSNARNDWGWKPDFDLSQMTADMLARLKIKLKISSP